MRAVLAAAALVLLGCDSSPGNDLGAPRASSFVVLPDTQFYACAFPETFERQTHWIRDRVESLGIGIVLHTGDVVDIDVGAQWDVAARALHLLDGHVPYLLVPGNHDLGPTRATLLNEYFVAEDLAGKGGAQIGTREPGRLENAFAIVTLGARPWLFLGIEFAPRDAALAWASSVLTQHADLPAVLFTHAHLYSDGVRYDRAITPLQPFHPDEYQLTPEQGIADGQDIWEALVLPHENVKLVLSGHVIPDGIARSSSQRPSGSVVHEVLTNFQTCELCPCQEVEGGGGYLRIFRLEEDGQRLHVTTYSPQLDRYLTDPENDFELSM